jgi:hypothetical protein
VITLGLSKSDNINHTDLKSLTYGYLGLVNLDKFDLVYRMITLSVITVVLGD